MPEKQKYDATRAFDRTIELIDGIMDKYGDLPLTALKKHMTTDKEEMIIFLEKELNGLEKNG